MVHDRQATDLIGPRWPIVIGMTLLAVALLEFSRLGVHAGFLGSVTRGQAEPAPPGRRMRTPRSHP